MALPCPLSAKSSTVVEKTVVVTDRSYGYAGLSFLLVQKLKEVGSCRLFPEDLFTKYLHSH